MHHTPKFPGLFLVLEGAHGSGKSTQARRLRDWLYDQACSVKMTHEVGGTLVGEKLRDIIEDPECASLLNEAPKSLLFLVLAARNLHVQKVIRPALEKGEIVICERFEGSTFAIQHHADQLEWDIISQMHIFAVQALTPDLTILLDIPAELGIARKRNQDMHGFWETRPLEYQEWIAQGYRDAACQLPRWVVIDATRDEVTVFAEIQQRVRSLLGKSVTH